MGFPGSSGGLHALYQRIKRYHDGISRLTKFAINIMHLNANNLIRARVRQNGVFNLITGQFRRKLRALF